MLYHWSISEDWDYYPWRSRGNIGGVMGMCQDPDRQMSHPGYLGGGTHRIQEQERRWGRLIS